MEKESEKETNKTEKNKGSFALHFEDYNSINNIKDN